MPREQLKIIAVTGHLEPEYIQRARDSGIDEVYPKPMPVYEFALWLKSTGFI